MLKKEFLTLFLITFTVVVVWIASDLIHALPSEKIDPELQAVLEPLNPNFDKIALEIINKIPDLKSSSVSIQSINQPTSTIQPTSAPVPIPNAPISTPSSSLINTLLNIPLPSAF